MLHDYVKLNARNDAIENMTNEVNILLEHGISLKPFTHNTNNAGYRLFRVM